MDFFTLSTSTVIYLAEATSRADAEGKDFHISFGEDGEGPYIKWKVGGGMWTPTMR